MTVRYTNGFLKHLKKLDVRIRKAFKKAVEIFSKSPNDLELDSHELTQEWEGFKSIDVAAAWGRGERFAY